MAFDVFDASLDDRTACYLDNSVKQSYESYERVQILNEEKLETLNTFDLNKCIERCSRKIECTSLLFENSITNCLLFKTTNLLAARNQTGWKTFIKQQQSKDIKLELLNKLIGRIYSENDEGEITDARSLEECWQKLVKKSSSSLTNNQTNYSLLSYNNKRIIKNCHLFDGKKRNALMIDNQSGDYVSLFKFKESLIEKEKIQKIVVQKYFNNLRKQIRIGLAHPSDQVKKNAKQELDKLDEFEKSMNENLLKQAENEPELKRMINELNSKRDEFSSQMIPFNNDLKYIDIDIQGSLKRMKDEVDKLDVQIETIMKEREELELRTIKHNNTDLFELIHHKRGEILISGSSDKTLKIWNAYLDSKSNETNVKLVRTLDEDEINESVWSLVQLDNEKIAVGLAKGKIQIRNTETNQLIRTLEDLKVRISALIVIENKRRPILASGSADMKIRLWDLDKRGKKALINIIEGHFGEVTSLVSFYDKNNDRFLLASASHDKTIKLWDIDTGNQIQTLTSHSTTITSLVFVSSSQQEAVGDKNADKDGYLISGSWNRTIKMWNLSWPFS